MNIRPFKHPETKKTGWIISCDGEAWWVSFADGLEWDADKFAQIKHEGIRQSILRLWFEEVAQK